MVEYGAVSEIKLYANRQKLPVFNVYLPSVESGGAEPPARREPLNFAEDFIRVLNGHRQQNVSIHEGLMTAAGLRAEEVVEARKKEGWHEGWWETVQPYAPPGCVGEVLVGAYQPDHHPITGENALGWFFVSQPHKDQLLKPYHRWAGVGVADNDFFDFMICVLVAGPC